MRKFDLAQYSFTTNAALLFNVQKYRFGMREDLNPTSSQTAICSGFVPNFYPLAVERLIAGRGSGGTAYDDRMHSQSL